MKKTEGQKSRETVPLFFYNIQTLRDYVEPIFHLAN
jgi:hypothetical protein